MRRIREPDLEGLPWADRLSRVQIVPGAGGAGPFARVVEDAAAAGVGLNITADRKAGRYLERLIGRAIGVLPIWPARISIASLPAWAARTAQEKGPFLDP